jgi:CNP1-like family
MNQTRRFLLFLGLCANFAQAADVGIEGAGSPIGRGADVPDWVEQGASLPAFPIDANLIEFYVSAANTNRFYIDGATLSVGPDEVVRYALVIRASGGASNVTYEGIRCGAWTYRLYATGRSDGAWAWLRSGDWRPIANQHHVVLSRDFFCPLGTQIRSAEEGRDALRNGRHRLLP